MSNFNTGVNKHKSSSEYKAGNIVCISCEKLFDQVSSQFSVQKEDIMKVKDRYYLILWRTYNKYVVCPITSQSRRDHRIELKKQDTLLRKMSYQASFIRIDMVYMVEIIWDEVFDTVSEQKWNEIVSSINTLLHQSPVIPSPLQRPQKPKVKK